MSQGQQQFCTISSFSLLESLYFVKLNFFEEKNENENEKFCTNFASGI